MAQWREFAATNEPDTCIWCGRKLRLKTYLDDTVSWDERMAMAQRGEKIPTVPAYDKRGDYGDGHFCGLRCAYSFAVAFADAGRRLQPREGVR